MIDIPLIANGDIDSPEKLNMSLDYTGADAIMIGRAAKVDHGYFEIAHCQKQVNTWQRLMLLKSKLCY